MCAGGRQRAAAGGAAAGHAAGPAAAAGRAAVPRADHHAAWRADSLSCSNARLCSRHRQPCDTRAIHGGESARVPGGGDSVQHLGRRRRHRHHTDRHAPNGVGRLKAGMARLPYCAAVGARSGISIRHSLRTRSWCRDDHRMVTVLRIVAGAEDQALLHVSALAGGMHRGAPTCGAHLRTWFWFRSVQCAAVGCWVYIKQCVKGCLTGTCRSCRAASWIQPPTATAAIRRTLPKSTLGHNTGKLQYRIAVRRSFKSRHRVRGAASTGAHVFL